MLTRLSRRLHVSWLVAWFSVALIGGIALAFWLHNPVWAGSQFLILSGVLLFIALIKRTMAIILLVVAAGLLLGLWRGDNEQLALQAYQKYIGQTVRLSGTVADDVTHKSGEAGMKLKNLHVDGRQLGGEVWAGTSSSDNIKRGDRVTLVGKLSPGFGTFAASLSYATLTEVSAGQGDWSRQVRDNFNSGMQKALPEQEAWLGIGYLTGQHNNLPEELTKQMQLVGLIHLVIAGGYNVTILVRLARRTFARFSKYLATLAAVSILIGIAFMAGFTAPMARTVVVTSLSLMAWYHGRKIHPLVLLPVAAAITAMITPGFVWGDVGWYLTFAAYGGLIMLAPMIHRLLWKDKKFGTLRQIAVDTLAVQIVTMPLMAFAFQQYSIYGLPANLLVLPVMPLTMLTALVAGLGGMVLPIPAAHIIGWPAAQLLSYTAHITNWLANQKGADAGAGFSILPLALAYAVIVVATYVLWRKTNFNFQAENIIE